MEQKDVYKRGIYLVRYTGPGQDDNVKRPGYLWLSQGCCKFGQSLNIEDVQNRYSKHCNGNAEVKLVGYFKDRDDIDAIEKKLHKRLHSRRLKNSNNRVSEWMEPINDSELKEIFLEVVRKHFRIWE